MIHGYIVVRKRNGSDGPQYPVKKSLKIGRGTHCDIRIHVQSVSEQHCLVLVEQGKRVSTLQCSALVCKSASLIFVVPIFFSGTNSKLKCHFSNSGEWSVHRERGSPFEPW